MIYAINRHGTEGAFTEKVWSLLKKDKNGWKQISEMGVTIDVPQIIKEFQASKKLEPVMDSDKLKAWLTDNNIKFHHKAGYDKLKSLYDDNRK